MGCKNFTLCFHCEPWPIRPSWVRAITWRKKNEQLLAQGVVAHTSSSRWEPSGRNDIYEQHVPIDQPLQPRHSPASGRLPNIPKRAQEILWCRTQVSTMHSSSWHGFCWRAIKQPFGKTACRITLMRASFVQVPQQYTLWLYKEHKWMQDRLAQDKVGGNTHARCMPTAWRIRGSARIAL